MRAVGEALLVPAGNETHVKYGYFMVPTGFVVMNWFVHYFFPKSPQVTPQSYLPVKVPWKSVQSFKNYPAQTRKNFKNYFFDVSTLLNSNVANSC